MSEGAIISDFIPHTRPSRRLTPECLWPDLKKKPGSKPGWGKRHEGAIISDFIPCTRVKKVINADCLWPALKVKPAGSKPGSSKPYSKAVIDLDDDFEIEFPEIKDEESDVDDFDDDIDDVLADIKPFAFSATAKLPSRVSREMDAHFERAREPKRKREEELKEVRKGKRPASADDDTPPRPSMTGAPPGGFMSDAPKTSRRNVTATVTQAALFSPARRIKTREAAHNREQASTSASALQQEKPKKGARAIMDDFMKILGAWISQVIKNDEMREQEAVATSIDVNAGGNTLLGNFQFSCQIQIQHLEGFELSIAFMRVFLFLLGFLFSLLSYFRPVRFSY